jgi:hypothetical protein
MGRGLRELGIGWIAAYSPQAKGRIERSFLTAQDRLVKDLRLAKVSTLEAANAFLWQEYWPEWNARFARPVVDFPNQHRALTPARNWLRFCATSSSASSATTTPSPSPGAATRSRATRRKPGCGSKGRAWNCG